MKSLPKNPISKAIKDPPDAYTWIRNRIIEESIVTPLLSRFLFDYEWDVAVILDACRYDLAVDRVSDHPIGLGKPERAYSAASNSADWIRRTFGRASRQELEQTAYITGNLFTNRLPDSSLAKLDRVWEYAWDEDLGCVPPRPITDRAISSHRQKIADRYIIHYMQPHLPPIREPSYEIQRDDPKEGEGADKISAWERVEDGDMDPEVIRQAYWNNLDPVLDEVSLLLNNIDVSKVIVTADHGNYLGEHGKWGHPNFEMKGPVRYVPWWETSARDAQTHEPAQYRTSQSGPSREKQLRALGYR